MSTPKAVCPPGKAGHKNHQPYTDEEREFLTAVERLRRTRGIRFPTAVQLLALLKSLGYRKVTG